MPPKAATKRKSTTRLPAPEEEFGGPEQGFFDDDPALPMVTPFMPEVKEAVLTLAANCELDRRDSKFWPIPTDDLLADVQHLLLMVARHAGEWWPRATWPFLILVERLADVLDAEQTHWLRPWWSQWGTRATGPRLEDTITGWRESLETWGLDMELGGPQEVALDPIPNLESCALEFVAGYYGLKKRDGSLDLEKAERVRKGTLEPPKMTIVPAQSNDNLPREKPRLDATLRLLKSSRNQPCPRPD